MILYHWGCQAAERLEPDCCFSSGDMGPGFYLTDDLVQARVLARQAAQADAEAVKSDSTPGQSQDVQPTQGQMPDPPEVPEKKE